MKGVAITISDEHAVWINNNPDFNLSLFVMKQLDGYIKEVGK